MYLSKAYIGAKSIGNPYDWHRALWTLFKGSTRGEQSPFLFHMESLVLGSGAHVLMLSDKSPMMQSDHASVLAHKEINYLLHPDQCLHFRLHANAAKKIRDKENPARKIRVPLIREEEQIAWLERKLGEGAIVNRESLKLRNIPPVYFRKGSRTGKVAVTVFEGLLRVKSIDPMQEYLTKGVGSAKAFGCGLLLVRRA